MFHLGVLHNKNNWRATSVNLNRKGSSHTSGGLIRKQKVGLQEMSCYTSGHKRRECIVWTREQLQKREKTTEQQAISLEAADDGLLCSLTFLLINTLVEGFGPHCHGAIVYHSNSFDVASMIPAAQCSIFRAIHRADSAALASSPHPNVSVGSAEAGDNNARGERACKNQRWVTKGRKKNQQKIRIMQHPPASDRVGESQEAAGGGIIPQYSFHSDNKNRKIYTVAPQNRESSTYRF